MHERLLVTFGDSWTWGSELDRPSTENWTYYLGQHLSAKTANLSYPASSIGHLAVQLFHYIDDIAENAREYKKIFAVGLTGTTRYLSYSQQLKEFVNITPEAVYRTSNIHESGRPPETVDDFRDISRLTYSQIQDVAWDRFILSQTIMLFDNYCRLNDVDCIFFSYFDRLEPYKNIPCNLFPTSITCALTGVEYSLPDIRSNRYFEGKLFHPNQSGHQEIARILKQYYDDCYPRH